MVSVNILFLGVKALGSEALPKADMVGVCPAEAFETADLAGDPNTKLDDGIEPEGAVGRAARVEPSRG